jgi:3,4-dihydroxy 2-butanone 4-phosphate synthase/GTP cyclohydrolase II
MSELLSEALLALANGDPIIVVDDHDRENEGDLVMAASAITTEQMAFFLRYGSGIVCVPMLDARAEALGLAPMVSDNTDLHGTAFTVSTDHLGTSTGISAADRAVTVRALADATTVASDLRRPGHIFPLRARAGGVLKRAGHTEAATDLLALAGQEPIAVITELVGDDGVPMSGEVLTAFAREHGICLISIENIIRHRRRLATLVTCTGRAQLPVGDTGFVAASYTSSLDGVEHFALILGDIPAADASEQGVLVRVHSECLTGDVFGSSRCDCGAQLRQAMDLITTEGAGVIAYLRGHEGRGIGLGKKIRAYALQEQGVDTVDANTMLGLPVDSREYGIGAAILADLGVHRLRLITNNPEKYGGLAGFDLELLERVKTPVFVTQNNLTYLRAKRDRLGHDIELPESISLAKSAPITARRPA